jgi:hypothetical protein
VEPISAETGEWCFTDPQGCWSGNWRLILAVISSTKDIIRHPPFREMAPDHHSGSTINRIRKAYEALKGFFDGGSCTHALYKFIFFCCDAFSPLFEVLASVLES